MNLKYMAKKGYRTNRGFMSVSINGGDFWWCHKFKKWVPYSELKYGGSSHAPCKTVRAFKRMLRNNSHILLLEPILVHRCYVRENGKFICNLDVKYIHGESK